MLTRVNGICQEGQGVVGADLGDPTSYGSLPENITVAGR